MNIKVKIEKLVFGGQGMGHIDGKATFVWNALPGEEVEARVLKNKSNFVESVAEKIITPSQERMPAQEDHYLSCSPWQILSASVEDYWKKEIARETFYKFGGLEIKDFDIVSGEKRFGYRNKMEFSFALDLHGRVSLGFFERGARRHMPITGCILAENCINVTAKNILSWINEVKIPIRSLKSLILRSNEQGQTIAALFIKDHLIFETLPELSSNFLGFHIYFSSHLSPASIPQELLYTEGQDFLITELNSAKLKFGLLSFFQINVPLFESALKDIEQFLKKDSDILDFYSGVGAISISLRAKLKSCTVVDNNKEAIEYAEENISLNKLKNFSARLVSAEKITKLIHSDKIVIFDPPREGLHQDVVKAVLEKKPRQIFYLSCNLTTQARDIKLLSSIYSIKFSRLYNFFPATPHVESLFILELNIK